MWQNVLIFFLCVVLSIVSPGSPVETKGLSTEQLFAHAQRLARTDPQESLNLYDSILEKLSDDNVTLLSKSLYGKGFVLHSLGRIKEAIKAAEKSVQYRSDRVSGRYHDALSIYYTMDNRIEDAYMSSKRALILDPWRATSYLTYGNLLMSSGRRGEALLSYRAGLDAAMGVLPREEDLPAIPLSNSAAPTSAEYPPIAAPVSKMETVPGWSECLNELVTEIVRSWPSGVTEERLGMPIAEFSRLWNRRRVGENGVGDAPESPSDPPISLEDVQSVVDLLLRSTAACDQRPRLSDSLITYADQSGGHAVSAYVTAVSVSRSAVECTNITAPVHRGNHLEALLSLGIALSRAGFVSESVSVLGAAAEFEPRPSVLFSYGVQLSHATCPHASTEILAKTAISEGHFDDGGVLLYAKELHSARRYDDAIDVHEILLSHYPSRPGSYVNLAMALLDRGIGTDNARASDLFRSAASLADSHVENTDRVYTVVDGWSGYNEAFRTTKRCDALDAIGNKAIVQQAMELAQKHAPDLAHQLSIVAEGFFLPEEWDRALDAVQAQLPVVYSPWVLKPVHRAGGVGVQIFPSLSAVLDEMVKNGENYVGSFLAQQYLHPPFLLPAPHRPHKFDVRMYVFITSIQPLRIYAYNDGYLRYADHRYIAPGETIDLPRRHLTSLAASHCPSEVNSVTTFQQLLLEFEKQGADPSAIWENTKSLLGATILSMVHYIQEEMLEIPKCDYPVVTNVTEIDNARVLTPCQFKVYGPDVFFAEDMTPTIIEVNRSPNMQRVCAENWGITLPASRTMNAMMTEAAAARAEGASLEEEWQRVHNRRGGFELVYPSEQLADLGEVLGII